jgi:hypothetical protein
MCLIRGTDRHTDVCSSRMSPLLQRNKSCVFSNSKISLFIETYHIVKVFQGRLILTSREEFYHWIYCLSVVQVLSCLPSKSIEGRWDHIHNSWENSQVSLLQKSPSSRTNSNFMTQSQSHVRMRQFNLLRTNGLYIETKSFIYVSVSRKAFLELSSLSQKEERLASMKITSNMAPRGLWNFPSSATI